MSEKNEMKEMDEDDFCGSHSFFRLLRSEEEKTEGFFFSKKEKKRKLQN